MYMSLFSCIIFFNIVYIVYISLCKESGLSSQAYIDFAIGEHFV